MSALITAISKPLVCVGISAVERGPRQHPRETASWDAKQMKRFEGFGLRLNETLQRTAKHRTSDGRKQSLNENLQVRLLPLAVSED